LASTKPPTRRAHRAMRRRARPQDSTWLLQQGTQNSWDRLEEVNGNYDCSMKKSNIHREQVRLAARHIHMHTCRILQYIFIYPELELLRGRGIVQYCFINSYLVNGGVRLEVFEYLNMKTVRKSHKDTRIKCDSGEMKWYGDEADDRCRTVAAVELLRPLSSIRAASLRPAASTPLPPI
jgi:hypothetical protein